MSGDRPDHGPWRNPYEHRRLVAVRRGGDRGLFELTVSPGADVVDLVGATARLPKVVYVDHRRAAPGDPAAVLLFRELPSAAEGVPTCPSPGGGPAPVSGWVPDVDALRAGSARGALDAALAVLLTPAAFGLHGRILVHGLAHCDPEMLTAAADTARRERAGRR